MTLAARENSGFWSSYDTLLYFTRRNVGLVLFGPLTEGSLTAQNSLVLAPVALAKPYHGKEKKYSERFTWRGRSADIDTLAQSQIFERLNKMDFQPNPKKKRVHSQVTWEDYSHYSENSLQSTVTLLEGLNDKRGQYLPGPLAKVLADCKRALANKYPDGMLRNGYGKQALEELIKAKGMK